MHGAWGGVTNYAFKEWCLTDTSRYEITGIVMVDGTIDGTVHLPGADIMVGGNCTFRGNITAGTMYIGMSDEFL